MLAIALEADAGRWLPLVGALADHSQRAVHDAAVKCLVEFLADQPDDVMKEAARRLASWLSDPNWARREDRLRFINNLSGLEMPELIPGLIWVLEHDDAPDNRAAAAEALTQYRDPRAVPALRHALESEGCEWNRGKIITALAESGGFSDDEMAEAVEAYARAVVFEKGERKIDSAEYGKSDKSLSLKVSIGRVLHESETFQATEGLAMMLCERAGALRAKQPGVARQILWTIEGAPLRVAQINLVERIGEGWADVESITLALRTRETLRKGASDELYGLIKQGGYAAGVAAAILNDEREWKSALEGDDAKAQLALLACARYLRDKMPVELAAKLLNSPNRALVKAAEGYLEVEDSAEARKLVLARHPGETYILGDLTAISNDSMFIDYAQTYEDALRKELRGRTGLDEIYAVLQMDSEEDFNGVIIRVRGGKAEMSVHYTEGRRNVRRLTDNEFEELKSFTSRQEIEDLGPQSYIGEDEKTRWNYEYLRLTKESGRRIALDDLQRAPKNPTRHEELSGLFYRLSRSGGFTVRYTIEDKISGVEVIYADKRQSVLRVCAEGGEIRALIEEKGAEYRQGGATATPEWREFSSGKPGEVKDEPSACRALNTSSTAPKDAAVIRHNPFGQPAQSDGALFYAKYGEDRGIWKTEPGMDPVKIVSGNYNGPVITPDGKWLVAIKSFNDAGKSVQQLIRHNLQNGEEFAVALPQDTFITWLVYIAAHGKVLLLNIGSYGKVGSGDQSYLLDPETGTVQPVKGEFRPLTSAVSRAPQSAGDPNAFWAAIYDWKKRTTSFGRYDSKNFVYTPLLEFPELELKSDDIWVDATSGKIWFAYKGHLLRLPMPAQTK
ncbi:MAG TPA: HEAT repeat domain-containing protein [Blastocatellia bacterium]|nr:HEAT repeat domain-containing protein [Blastocatellia bacterium]